MSQFLIQAVPGHVSVDTFFMISGCLVAYLMFKELDKLKGRINFAMLYIHRYLRFVGHKIKSNLSFFLSSLILDSNTDNYDYFDHINFISID